MKKATYIVITAAVVLAAALLLTGAAAAATDEVTPLNDTHAAGHPFQFITQFIGATLTATLNGVADIAEEVNEAAMNVLPAEMGTMVAQAHAMLMAPLNMIIIAIGITPVLSY